MIFLTRTTIETDGSHATEIAVLEDEERLKAYEAQGFTPCAYEVYSAAWRRKHTLLYERQLAVPAQLAQASAPLCCPECSCDQITVFVGGQRRCRRCQNNW